MPVPVSALVDRGDRLGWDWAGVFGERAVESVVFELFEDLGGPAGGAADGEDGGEEVGGDAEAVVDCGAVEIDVGVEAFAFAHDLGDAFAHADPLGFAEFLGELDGHFLEVRGAWVEDLVDAVADAHDFFLFGEPFFDPWIDVGFLTDFLEHVDDALVGSAVEWAFESADGAGDGGVHVAEGGDGDACGERAGVHAVVGVEDVGDVERAGGFCAGFFACDEPEEAAGLAEVGADGGHGVAGAVVVVGGDDEGDLGADGEGAFFVEGAVLIVAAAVEDSEEGDPGAEDVHGGSVLGEGVDEAGDFRGEVAVGAEFVGEGGEFRVIGELAVVEEVDDFFEGTIGDEIVDGVAEVAEFSVGTVDIAETGFIGDDTFETFSDHGHKIGEERGFWEKYLVSA